MAYKTIATIYRNEAVDRPHLAAAIAIAEREDAHLHVLALGTDRTQPGAYYAGAEAIALQSAMTEAIAESQAAEASARTILAGALCPWEVTGAVAQVGALGQIIARRAALTDLVVLPQPYGEGRSVEDAAITEAALFDTRTPVLILPHGMKDAPAARSIVLAWNQSAEALTAVRAALPMLKAAQNVNIAIIDPPPHDLDRSDPGGLLAEMLSRHGVRCDITVLARTMPKISDVLIRHISDRSADLLVMGGYGHSRFREAIFGGTTRNMLEHCKVPILMAH